MAGAGDLASGAVGAAAGFSPWMAVPAILGSAYKIYTGIKQNNEADRILAANARPTKNVQSEYYNNAALANFNAANRGLPGQGLIQNQLASAQGRAVGGAIQSQRDPSSIAAVLGASQGNYNQGIENLGVQAAKFQQGQQGIAYGMNTALAQQKDQAWDWNSKQKYLGAVAAASALKYGGGLNTAAGVGDAANIGTAIAFGGKNPYGQLPPYGQGQYGRGGNGWGGQPYNNGWGNNGIGV